MQCETSNWLEVKCKLLPRFATVAAAAAHYGCSTNSLRNFATCPRVAAKLARDGVLPAGAGRSPDQREE